MPHRGFRAFLITVTALSLLYGKDGHASYTVTFERHDAHTVRAVVQHGKHDPFLLPIRQIEKYLSERPDLLAEIQRLLENDPPA